MKILKTLKDIELLLKIKRIHSEYLNNIHNYFIQLRHSLQTQDSDEDFNLHKYGLIIILEQEDSIRDLSNVGLDPNNDGLLGSWPEYIEHYDLDTISFYKIMVLKQAKCPTIKTIEQFDFSKAPYLSKKEVMGLFDCKFIDEKMNLLFLGAPGTGKTHISLYTNGYAMTCFSEVGIHDAEVEEWLDENCTPVKTPIPDNEEWGNLF